MQLTSKLQIYLIFSIEQESELGHELIFCIIVVEDEIWRYYLTHVVC